MGIFTQSLRVISHHLTYCAATRYATSTNFYPVKKPQHLLVNIWSPL
jgi:hypothetical protein